MKIFQLKEFVSVGISLFLFALLYQVFFNPNIIFLKQVLLALPFAIVGPLYMPLRRLISKLMKKEELPTTKAYRITEFIIVGTMLFLIFKIVVINPNLSYLSQFVLVLPIALTAGVSLFIGRIALTDTRAK